MENLLSAFLLKYKYCPLPTVGTLNIQQEAAVSSITDKTILAPKPVIVFTEKETDAEPLLNYIASAAGSTVPAASDALSHYCERLQEIQPYEKVEFDSLGTFSKDEVGILLFSNAAAIQNYLPPVAAERVIHPDASHEMLVGDKATNTVYMTEMLATEEKKKMPKWVWAAVALAVAASAAVVFSIVNHQKGSSAPIKAKDAPATYTTGSN